MAFRHVIFVLLTSMVLAAVPSPTDALQVVITTKRENPAAPGTVSTVTATLSPGVQTTPNGIPTTTVEITRRSTTTGGVLNRTVGGFVISRAIASEPATVIAEQSGALERITINNTVIIAPDPCGPPCTVEIKATSHSAEISATNTIPPDFPNRKLQGAQPAAVIAQGFFIPGAALGAPAGSNISVTGRAAGTNLNGTRRSVNVINPLPRGSGDSPTSLSSDCSGQADCAFTADEFNIAFNDSMGETIQYSCESHPNPCLPYLQVITLVHFASPGDSVDLPVGCAQSRTGTAAPLREEFLPTSGNMDVNHLIIHRLRNVAMTSVLVPDEKSNGMDPSKESVLWSVGRFTAVFPAGSFKKLFGGRKYAAARRVGDIEVAAAFERRSDGRWKFIGGAHGFPFTATESPLNVRVDVGGVEGDLFRTTATPTFLD